MGQCSLVSVWEVSSSSGLGSEWWKEEVGVRRVEVTEKSVMVEEVSKI